MASSVTLCFNLHFEKAYVHLFNNRLRMKVQTSCEKCGQWKDIVLESDTGFDLQSARCPWDHFFACIMRIIIISIWYVVWKNELDKFIRLSRVSNTQWIQQMFAVVITTFNSSDNNDSGGSCSESCGGRVYSSSSRSMRIPSWKLTIVNWEIPCKVIFFSLVLGF